MEIANGIANAANFTNSGLSLKIGANAYISLRNIAGSIGGVKIYNRGLTPIEVKQNYNALKNRYTQ